MRANSIAEIILTMRGVVGMFLVAAIAMSGCGGGGDDEVADSACEAAPAGMLDALAEGLTKDATLERGQVVMLAADEAGLGYDRVVAVEVADVNGSETALLAAGGVGGPFLAVDNMARLYFSWGAAAQDGSPIARWRDDVVAGSDAARTAAGCL